MLGKLALSLLLCPDPILSQLFTARLVVESLNMVQAEPLVPNQRTALAVRDLAYCQLPVPRRLWRLGPSQVLAPQQVHDPGPLDPGPLQVHGLLSLVRVQ